MAERRLRVYYLPQFVAEHELAGSTVVVIDLLRASTTICQALASGAKEVVPFVEIDETMAAAEGADRAETVLGGERAGLGIAGFDLGNSPAEYTPSAVFGRRVLFTTTNGTRALRHAQFAARVLVGAIVNLSALASAIRQHDWIDIVCAGTAGHVTREDILAAGALVHRLTAAGGDAPGWQLNDAALAARGEWEELLTAAGAAGRSASDQLAVELRNTPGGRNLIDIGLESDLVDCARLDALDVVPELDLRAWRITAI